MQTVIEPTAHSGHLIGTDDQTFRTKFNQKPFMVTHSLAGHPLFEFSHMFKLLSHDNSKMFWDMGDIKPGDKWRDTKAGSLTAEEAFERIETSGAWIIFRSIQRDPDYRALLDDYLKEVEERSGVDFKKDVKVKDAIIFATSPKRVATFHVDRECSFLLQVRGTKTLYIFDKNDRDVITEQELERFWTVDNNAATYREQYQNRAMAVELVPGNGAHIPVGCPHWVKNHDNVSISLNINIHFHEHLRGNIYKTNYYLRKMGLNPAPLGKSPTIDAIKGNMMQGIVSMGRLLKGKPLPPSPAKYRHTGPPWKMDPQDSNF